MDRRTIEANKEPRTYFPIWEVLRKDKLVVVKVPPHLVIRVKKAVVKEKHADIGFKFFQLEGEEVRLFLRSSYDKATWELKLWLVESQVPLLTDL